MANAFPIGEVIIATMMLLRDISASSVPRIVARGIPLYTCTRVALVRSRTRDWRGISSRDGDINPLFGFYRVRVLRLS
jgi:hypothetical protein